MNWLSGFHVIFTVLIFVAFCGVVAWAYSKRRRRDFSEAARLPLDAEGEDAGENRR